MSTTVGIGLAVLGLAAAAFAVLWRSAEGTRGVLAGELETVTGEREELATRLARETAARKKQAEELATLRKRADKAKRREARAEKGGGDRAVGTAARMADLEAELERVERERERGRTEREHLTAEVARLEAQVEVARKRPAPLETPTPATPVAVVPESDSTAEIAELREQLAKMGEALELAKQTEARMRKRMSNQEQLYASVRSELEVKKDRLRAQEERIQRLEALQVAIAD